MPEYRAPGVFVEEISFRQKSIEGVGTSATALVGPTCTGPLRGRPEVITSFSEFVRIYGGCADLDYAGAVVTNYTALAARAFFDNGGTQLFVSRIVNGVNESDSRGDLSSACRASKTSAGATVTFRSRFPGAMGNYTLEIRWRDSLRRTFDLDVRLGNGTSIGDVIWSHTNLTTARDQINSLDKALPVFPQKREDQVIQPVSCELGGGDVPSMLQSLFDPGPLNSPQPRYLITLSGGSDGTQPTAVDYAGEIDDFLGSTGLAAFESSEDIAIVMAPAAAADEAAHTAVLLEIQKHCRKMRYRIGIADSRKGMTPEEVQTFRTVFDDSRMALYHPWVVVTDPTGRQTNIAVPPSGFIAGIYARNDVERGVHKAPANEVVRGALRFEQDINKFQQDVLNPVGINCLRSFPGRGNRVWGARTLSSDPEWKYVNVRRYFMYLERSIETSTRWAVFEPNGDTLWNNIRGSIEDFLFNEWHNGQLLGATAKEAYFTRCDRSTMTQNDLDNGLMICVVGVATIKPAEFIIFRVSQKTAVAG
ncbi:MAG TPA: phage tail sheath family protein [Desulfuromonadales bacterium]|nr:phage tail sheath family protein [Desulfuromonadales bacterium]